MLNNVLSQKFKPNLTIDEFLEECQKYIESYSCPLCEGILFESIFDNCGHSFCKNCSEILLEHTKKCPFSNNNLNPPFSSNIVVNTMIEKQKVYCKNKKNGCSWTGKLSERKNHLLNDCLKQLVNCDYFPNCEFKSLREEMINHIKECKYKIINCEYCNEKILYKDQEEHNKICPNIPVDCSNKCGMKIPLNKINHHMQNECLESVTECPFLLVGCEYYERRKFLKEHLDKNLERHLRMVTEKINELNNKINEQNGIINNLNEENNNLKTEVMSIKESFNNSNNDLLNSINTLQFTMNYMRAYINIPISNFVPNFYDKTLISGKEEILELNKDEFTIRKCTQNYGWYGISSEYLFQNINISGSLTKTSMIDFNINQLDKIVINMKLTQTSNSCIMFGITWSEAQSPIENGYYHQTNEDDKSFIFYCFNCSIYSKGVIVAQLEEEKKCNEGDVISLIISNSTNYLEFRKNGKCLYEPFNLSNFDNSKIRACVDLCDYGDKVEFLR